MVGSLLYAAIATRPDIAHDHDQAVGVVSKFCSQPTEAHLTAVKRILLYLNENNFEMKFQMSDKALVAYSDADWAGDHDCHSTTGNIFLMAQDPISWVSKK